jgi:hypothetical protein
MWEEAVVEHSPGIFLKLVRKTKIRKRTFNQDSLDNLDWGLNSDPPEYEATVLLI